MKRQGLIFSRLESFKKVKFPHFLKNILIQSAYDTTAALETLNKAKVLELEQFVSTRLYLLQDTVYLDETGNLKKSPFKFLLGHEALILQFPIDVREFLTKKKVIPIPASDDLKLLIIKKIQDLFAENNLRITAEVSAINRSNDKGECRVRCPYGPSRLSCSFRTSWKVNNYTKHFKSCQKKSAQKNTQRNQAIQRSSPASVLRELQNAVP